MHFPALNVCQTLQPFTDPAKLENPPLLVSLHDFQIVPDSRCDDLHQAVYLFPHHITKSRSVR
jgi:hypothetical protein